MSNRNYDVIIIGSGAGGGTLALKLAPSGKRILILERGGSLPREKQNWDTTEVFVKNRYVSKDTWYDKDGKRRAHMESRLFLRGKNRRRGKVPRILHLLLGSQER